MIRYIKRKNLDTLKYDTCIQNSKNARIYALSYYLDIVADNWNALVLNDYQAVMPLPWRSKYFVKYIYPPCWTQQLGVFSTLEINTGLVDSFLKAIPKTFLKTTLQLNSACTHTLFSEKTNYTLNLNNSYTEIHNSYRKDRKDRLKKFTKSGLTITIEKDITNLIELFETNYKGSTNLVESDYLKLKELSKNRLLNPLVLKIYNHENRLISGSLFLKDQNRIYYLFSANNKEGNKIQGNTAILNSIINKYCESNYILDFEGSMIPGIASFFSSFGSKKETYFLYSTKIID